MKISGRQTLLLMGLVCLLPIAASYISYYVMVPEKTNNYGVLLEPKPLPGEPLRDLDARPFTMEQTRGRWVLLFAGPASCDETCRKNLYFMRQVRTALGKDMNRVERVWLLDDDALPDPGLRKEHPGLIVVKGAGSTLLTQLRTNGAGEPCVYLVDPLGNLMLRFPFNPDPKRMLKDLERLLKASRVG